MEAPAARRPDFHRHDGSADENERAPMRGRIASRKDRVQLLPLSKQEKGRNPDNHNLEGLECLDHQFIVQCIVEVEEDAIHHFVEQGRQTHEENLPHGERFPRLPFSPLLPFQREKRGEELRHLPLTDSVGGYLGCKGAQLR